MTPGGCLQRAGTTVRADTAVDGANRVQRSQPARRTHALTPLHSTTGDSFKCSWAQQCRGADPATWLTPSAIGCRGPDKENTRCACADGAVQAPRIRRPWCFYPEPLVGFGPDNVLTSRKLKVREVKNQLNLREHPVEPLLGNGAAPTSQKLQWRGARGSPKLIFAFAPAASRNIKADTQQRRLYGRSPRNAGAGGHFQSAR